MTWDVFYDLGQTGVEYHQPARHSPEYVVRHPDRLYYVERSTMRGAEHLAGPFEELVPAKMACLMLIGAPHGSAHR